MQWDSSVVFEQKGFSINFHEDFLKGTELAQQIKKYGFFSYSVNEALHLSPSEEKQIESIVKNIEIEYHNNQDEFSKENVNIRNQENSDKDCNGICFGNSTLDDCEVCGGTNETCLDSIFGNGPDEFYAFIVAVIVPILRYCCSYAIIVLIGVILINTPLFIKIMLTTMFAQDTVQNTASCTGTSLDYWPIQEKKIAPSTIHKG